MRKEGLSGVEQLMTKHGSVFVSDNLSELLKAIIPLTVTIEEEVRKKSFDLIHKVFQHVSIVNTFLIKIVLKVIVKLSLKIKIKYYFIINGVKKKAKNIANA